MALPIEASFTLIQEPTELLHLDSIETPHVALGLVSEILDPVDRIPKLAKNLE